MQQKGLINETVVGAALRAAPTNVFASLLAAFCPDLSNSWLVQLFRLSIVNVKRDKMEAHICCPHPLVLDALHIHNAQAFGHGTSAIASIVASWN